MLIIALLLTAMLVVFAAMLGSALLVGQALRESRDLSDFDVHQAPAGVHATAHDNYPPQWSGWAALR